MSGGHHGPSSLEEMQEAEEIKAAETLHESIKGFHLSAPFNVKIEGERLGVRHDLEHALEHEYHKNVQDMIIDTRVTEQLRKKVKEHKEHHKTGWRHVPGSSEWRHNRVADFKNIVRAFKNPLRWFRDDYDEFSAEIEDEYGHASDVREMKKKIGAKLDTEIFAGLGATDKDAINAFFGVSPGNAVDVTNFTNASPTLLSQILATHGAIFSGKKCFKNLLELRRIEAVEASKVLSVRIFDPSVLRKEVSHSLEHSADPTDRTILDKLKKLSGDHFDHGLEHDHKLRTLFAELRFKRHSNAVELENDLDDILKVYPVDKRTVVERELNETEKQNNTQLDENTAQLREVAAKLVKKIEEKELVDATISSLATPKAEIQRLKAKKDSEESSCRTKADAARAYRKTILQDIDTTNTDIGNEELKLSNNKSDLTQRKKNLREEEKQNPQDNAAISALKNEITKIEGDKPGIEREISRLRNLLKAKQKLKTDADHEIEKFERDLREVATRDEFADLKNKERELETQERDLNKQKTNLTNDIHHEEMEYKNAANVFIRFIEGTMKRKILGTAANNDVKIQLVKDSVGAPHVDPIFIKGFVNDLVFRNEFEGEIGKMKSVGTKVEYLSPDLLLFELKKRDVQRLGKFHDDEQINKVARMATSFAQIDAKNVELFRAGNRMIAESKHKGWKGLGGIWHKSKQQIASAFFNSDTFKGRDLLEHIGGLDHAFECFKDLPVDASRADIRNAIKHHGGISTENLMKFYLYLQEAIKSFTINHTRKVQIADKDWPIEQVALFAEYIHGELEAREFIHKIEHPDNDEDKKLKKDNKASYFLKLSKQRDESLKNMEAAHLHDLRNPESNWQVSFVKSLMKGKFGEAYDRLLQEGKAHGLSGKNLKQHIANGGVPMTIVNHLMTGLALKEAYDITSSGVRWVGGKLFGASKAAAKTGVKAGTSLVGAAWNRLGKPALSATGRGLGAVGRGALRAGKFVAWDTPKFFLWDAPKWTVQTTAKAVFWPFKMLGRGTKAFWEFFHYTPEKAARDKAWYDAKKAASAGHGGHDAHGHGGHAAGH